MKNGVLEGSYLCRGPHSRGDTKFENHVVEAAITPKVFDGKAGIRIMSNLSSKGGRITDIELIIPPRDFGNLLDLMIEANSLQLVTEMSIRIADYMAKRLEEEA